MNPFLERSVFLRSLNYLRVSHQYANRYSFLYPILAAFCTSLLLLGFSPDLNTYGPEGLLAKLTPFLAVIAPFFLASLAAVATFSGPAFFDKPFDMKEPVTLSIVGEMGAVEPVDITPRHFLSLLFGYCCVVALTLFVLATFIPQIAGGIATYLGSYAEFLGWVGLVLFLFLFYQVILATLLGIYYLSDKIHR